MPLFNVPVDVTFSRRVDRPDGTGMDWVEEGFSEIFANRKVIIFGLPGAFTPTCSTTHLPGFEAYAQQLKKDHNFLSRNNWGKKNYHLKAEILSFSLMALLSSNDF